MEKKKNNKIEDNLDHNKDELDKKNSLSFNEKNILLQKIAVLENQILNQNIIINSLLFQIKTSYDFKSDFKNYDMLNNMTVSNNHIIDKNLTATNVSKKTKLSEEIEIEKKNKGKPIDYEIQVDDLKENKLKEYQLYENMFEQLGISNLGDEIVNIFSPSSNKRIEFKTNYTLQQFIDYIGNSFEFQLDIRKPHKIKNPIRGYVISNLDKIILYLMQNINILSLKNICTTLFYINNEIEQKHKLVILFDIILLLKERTKLLYIISALFNNVFGINNGNVIIVKTVISIIYHQYLIEKDLYKNNAKIIKYLNDIKTNFDLFRYSENLFDLVNEFINIPIKKPIINFKEGRIDNEFEIVGWSIRTICHMLDWDYTYNTLILTKLDYKNNPFHTLVTIYLTKDIFDSFGYENSVQLLCNEFISVMNNDSEIAMLCYIFIKEINTKKAEEYTAFLKQMIIPEKINILNKIELY